MAAKRKHVKVTTRVRPKPKQDAGGMKNRLTAKGLSGSAMPLEKKLQLKAGMKLRLLGAPKGFVPPPGGDGSGGEALLVFVTRQDQALLETGKVLGRVARGLMLWVAYPKGGSGVPTDLNRDILWKSLAPTGLGAVRQIALDETWTAMRFRSVPGS